MPIELRIQSGSRAGETVTFDKPVIAVGRHPMSDLQFDPRVDIDVSTRHGEIRQVDGQYVVVDSDSTNGTFVNGQRIPRGGSHEIRTGDVIGFGHHGPTVAVGRAQQTGPIAKPRVSTGERVAHAVRQQTRMLKIAMTLGVVVLAGVAGALYWMGHREAAESAAKLRAATEAYEETSKRLEARLAATNDTGLINNLTRQRDSLVAVAQSARGAQAVVVQQALRRHEDLTRAIDDMNLPAVRAANNAAVALIHADAGGVRIEATGFGVTRAGGVITNRHVVIDSAGNHARHITVKFADTDVWHPAHIVRSLADADLALLQIDESGPFPAVKGVASSVTVPVGGTIASIGYPLGSDTPMDGLIARTTLTPGTVSKSIVDVLQIDSYATHGSSGSPVFDGQGNVIGVIYAGPKEAAGRIVYAVPSPHLVSLLNTR